MDHPYAASCGVDVSREPDYLTAMGQATQCIHNAIAMSAKLDGAPVLVNIAVSEEHAQIAAAQFGSARYGDAHLHNSNPETGWAKWSVTVRVLAWDADFEDGIGRLLKGALHPPMGLHIVRDDESEGD